MIELGITMEFLKLFNVLFNKEFRLIRPNILLKKNNEIEPRRKRRKTQIELMKKQKKMQAELSKG